jgi:hypothetical protein
MSEMNGFLSLSVLVVFSALLLYAFPRAVAYMHRRAEKSPLHLFVTRGTVSGFSDAQRESFAVHRPFSNERSVIANQDEFRMAVTEVMRACVLGRLRPHVELRVETAGEELTHVELAALREAVIDAGAIGVTLVAGKGK